ncbi:MULTISPECIES: protein-glutamate methylesterase/protein-glutamine glutaminase [unclassified Cytobacillus]|uniref:protein-glutamate methylesterase/protein-glutamine glutaminase n=1 Tax=unclassified Cytobacillus TaxID=2675268 RepID=UPI00135B4251|nr:chemotaxis response regulator protein-glutamate methylesterase [Cytobacillus sp. AMY 15.2]KAF0820392.1 Chemotaxis response regulator protein-glutamate methylesterase CheB [Bacillus sp. ZZV12-4809]MCM3089614.1 chemotaxis response regulator protein-glutamate methylesterase [Cytobacillus sp. AMY 15.2]
MNIVKVLVIDDSAFMRKLIADLLSQDERIRVIGTARNGEEGLRKIKELNPDAVTLDVEMPVLNGLEALKIIMKTMPVPVVMLSSTTKEGAENTFTAMEYGAVDFIAKPSGPISLDLHKIKTELTDKVVQASKVNIKVLADFSSIGKKTAELKFNYSKIEPFQSIQTNRFADESNLNVKQLICVGTSTGGPRALQKVLVDLPGNLDAPILIVQHMPAGFTKSLASRLNGLSALSVKEAQEGDILENGTAYIAPGGFHVTAERSGRDLVIHLDESPPRNGHRPSVDVMFESIGEIKGVRKIAVIMTGMGADGRNGLMAMKKSGEVKVIAESKESSIVFGMPRAVIESGLADDVQKIERIAKSILKFV